MGLMNYRYSCQVKGYAEPVDGSPGVAHAVGSNVRRMDRLRDAPAWGAVALCAFAVAIGTGLWHVPGAVRAVYRDVGELRTATALDRQLSGARSVDVDTRVFVEARRLIPSDARYAVVTGPNVNVSNSATLAAVRPFAGYWLLPRRRLIDVSEADWVVSYGGDLSALGVEYVRIVEVARGLAVAEVRR
jgi:hypothetical protein